MTHTGALFLQTLRERGLFHQASEPERLALLGGDKPLVGYIGYDCTADSLTVGNLVSIMMLHWLQQCGGKPIVVMGGGTTKIGDPSGKDSDRTLLTDDVIEQNKASIKKTFARFLRFGDGATDAVLVDNKDWLDSLNYIAFLRDVGKHFSVNRMLTLESVKLRLDREQPLSFIEFNYSILQAYDFVMLHDRYGCVLQMGGSDQWGNIIAGVDLGRRMRGADLFAVTAPLLTTAAGKKMGKSESGAVWLSEHRLSAYDYYQFWRNSDDADVGRFLRIYTDLPLSEIERLESLTGSALNDAKKVLAFTATALCHGEAAATQAAATAATTFSGGVGSDLPTLAVTNATLEAGLGLIAVLRELGLIESNSAGFRLLESQAIKINDAVITDRAYRLQAADFINGNARLSVGKKKHAVVQLKA